MNLFPVSALLETLLWLTDVSQNKETPWLLGVKDEVKPETKNSHWSGAFPSRPLPSVLNQLCDVGKSTYLRLDFLASTCITHNSQKVERTQMSTIKRDTGVKTSLPSAGYSGVSLGRLELKQTPEDGKAGRWNELGSWAAELTSTGVILSPDFLLSEILRLKSLSFSVSWRWKHKIILTDLKGLAHQETYAAMKAELDLYNSNKRKTKTLFLFCKHEKGFGTGTEQGDKETCSQWSHTFSN